MIINYIGADNKVGTTMIAASVASMLGEGTALVCKGSAAGSQYEAKAVLWPEEDLHPKEVSNILEGLKNSYENIVIDSGSDIYSGLVVGAIENADINVVVTTQQKSSLDRLKVCVSDLIKPMKVKCDLVINKYIEGAFASIKDITALGEFGDVNVVRYSQYGWEAEQQMSSLMKYPGFYRDLKKYEKTIRFI